VTEKEDAMSAIEDILMVCTIIGFFGAKRYWKMNRVSTYAEEGP
jgi:hypothetical protein